MYVHHLAQYNATAWAIRPERLASMLDVTGRIHGSWGLSTGEDAAKFQAAIEAAAAARGRRPAAGAVARIRIEGPIEQKASIWTLLFGGAALDMIQAEFDAAVADPDVKGILLEVDSPGGTVYGVPELARRIRAARGSKPIVAVANAEAASAAYYLASQADEVVATPSGQVGSIGVVYLHTDLTGMAEKQGVAFRIFRSQERKADVNPYESLSDEAAADIQAKVDAYDAMFVRDVARGRGVSVEKVRSDYGAGRMFLAADALKAGLIDRVETLEEAASRLASGKVAAKSAPQASEESGEPGDPAGTGPIEVDEATLRERRARLVELMSPRRAKVGV